MAAKVDLYNTYYDKFAADAQAAVRRETYGEDIGQSSWMTADELRHFIKSLAVDASTNVLEIGSGSGGPALFIAAETGCRIVGTDVNEFGARNANELAASRGLADRAEFHLLDASEPLPFDDSSFDVVFSNDVMCHIANRQKVLKEWLRVLKPGGRMLFTDALVVTGIVSHEEIARRSSIGLYFYVPPGENERMIASAGFELLDVADLTPACAEISKRWHTARERFSEEMRKLEGESGFDGLQDFLSCTHDLTSERRLSRFAYLAEKTASFEPSDEFEPLND
jgi:ubiquinone/menaquinone biosynthesis C-methylase UbiE